MGPNHVEFVESLGADLVIDSMTLSTEQFLARVREKTDDGVHGVLALAPCTSSIELAIQALRPTGTAVLVALPPGNISIPIYDVVTKGWHILGSLVGTRADLNAALGFAARGEVVCKTHVEPMENYRETLENLRKGNYKGRVVFANAPEGVV